MYWEILRKFKKNTKQCPSASVLSVPLRLRSKFLSPVVLIPTLKFCSHVFL